MKSADVCKWLRQEAATCEDLARLQKTKVDRAAFEKKMRYLRAAVQRIEALEA